MLSSFCFVFLVLLFCVLGIHAKQCSVETQYTIVNKETEESRCYHCRRCPPGEEPSIQCGSVVDKDTPLGDCSKCKKGMVSRGYDVLPCRPVSTAQPHVHVGTYLSSTTKRQQPSITLNPSLSTKKPHLPPSTKPKLPPIILNHPTTNHQSYPTNGAHSEKADNDPVDAPSGGSNGVTIALAVLAFAFCVFLVVVSCLYFSGIERIKIWLRLSHHNNNRSISTNDDLISVDSGQSPRQIQPDTIPLSEFNEVVVAATNAGTQNEIPLSRGDLDELNDLDVPLAPLQESRDGREGTAASSSLPKPSMPNESIPSQETEHYSDTKFPTPNQSVCSMKDQAVPMRQQNKGKKMYQNIGRLKLRDLGDEMYTCILNTLCRDKIRLRNMPGKMGYLRSQVEDLNVDIEKDAFKFASHLLTNWSEKSTEHDVPAFIEILKQLDMGDLKDKVFNEYEKKLRIVHGT